jgi:hypothetical protein
MSAGWFLIETEAKDTILGLHAKISKYGLLF